MNVKVREAAKTNWDAGWCSVGSLARWLARWLDGWMEVDEKLSSSCSPRSVQITEVSSRLGAGRLLSKNQGCVSEPLLPLLMLLLLS